MAKRTLTSSQQRIHNMFKIHVGAQLHNACNIAWDACIESRKHDRLTEQKMQKVIGFQLGLHAKLSKWQYGEPAGQRFMETLHQYVRRMKIPVPEPKKVEHQNIVLFRALYDAIFSEACTVQSVAKVLAVKIMQAPSVLRQAPTQRVRPAYATSMKKLLQSCGCTLEDPSYLRQLLTQSARKRSPSQTVFAVAFKQKMRLHDVERWAAVHHSTFADGWSFLAFVETKAAKCLAQPVVTKDWPKEIINSVLYTFGYAKGKSRITLGESFLRIRHRVAMPVHTGRFSPFYWGNHDEFVALTFAPGTFFLLQTK